MIRLYRHYQSYRAAGLYRADAFRFAWMVVAGGASPIPLRGTHRP